MRFLLTLAALTGSALANEVIAIAPRHLYARQGGSSFVPPSTLESGCASNEVQCPGSFNGLPYCVTPSLGDVCCAEGYGCPGGSFCLTAGYCCPDGIDPATCATAQGVTLPENFKPGNTVAFSAPTTPATSAPPAQKPSPEVTSSPSSSVAVLTTSAPTPPYVIPSNSTSALGTATATGTGAGAGSTSVTPFTGGAAGSLFDRGNGVLLVAGIGAIVGLCLW